MHDERSTRESRSSILAVASARYIPFASDQIMRRTSSTLSRAIALLLAAGAIVSCKRVERAFSSPAMDRNISDGMPNTPVRAGGAAPVQPITSDRSMQSDDGNAYDLSEGMQLYRAMNCSACHGNYGGGGIGPALSDNKWIYGWNPQIIFDDIAFGRPNGMPSFAGRMTDQQVWRLVSYVRSLSGMTPSLAAPGRGDEMAGDEPPNSVSQVHPESSTQEREELEHKERTTFEQLGWVNRTTGRMRVSATTQSVPH